MIDYPLASNTWDEHELNALKDVIDQSLFTMGANVLKYEEEFSKFFGAKYSVMVNSGSSANLLMIAALFYTKNLDYKLSRGDEIIVPAVSWSTTYFPLQQYGLKVKFVDVDPNTLNIDLDKLESAISNDTRAILSVNLLGNPNNFDRLNQMIQDKNIFLLEDNCESMGASFNDKQAGTFGLMGTFSSFYSHLISTMEGGCIVTDDEELYHILLCMRAHGWTRNLPKVNKVSGEKSDDAFEESFKFYLPGYNLRPLELNAVVGIEQLKKLPGFIAARRKNAILFQEAFNGHPHFDIQQEIGNSCWFGFSIVLKETAPFTRKQFVEKLNENGIECRPIVSGNFLKNKEILEYFDYEIAGSIEVAEYIEHSGLFIGNHHIDLIEQINAMKNIL